MDNKNVIHKVFSEDEKWSLSAMLCGPKKKKKGKNNGMYRKQIRKAGKDLRLF